jgi:hypothetical protein
MGNIGSFCRGHWKKILELYKIDLSRGLYNSLFRLLHLKGLHSMKNMLVVVGALLAVLASSAAFAQDCGCAAPAAAAAPQVVVQTAMPVVTYYAPAAPVVAYYAPAAPVVAYSPYVVARPVVAPYVVARPVAAPYVVARPVVAPVYGGVVVRPLFVPGEPVRNAIRATLY